MKVTGFLYLDIDEFEVAQIFFQTYLNFAKYVGFDVVELEEFVKGSWMRKVIDFIKSSKNSEEVQRIYEKKERRQLN